MLYLRMAIIIVIDIIVKFHVYIDVICLTIVDSFKIYQAITKLKSLIGHFIKIKAARDLKFKLHIL